MANALARSYHWTIAPYGNTALNFLGLSTQVTATWSYISDGTYRIYEWNSTRIEFKHRANREITGLSYITVLVVQELKHSEKTMLHQRLLGYSQTDWVHDIIKNI